MTTKISNINRTKKKNDSKPEQQNKNTIELMVILFINRPMATKYRIDVHAEIDKKQHE